MSRWKDQRSYLSPNAFAGGGRERNYGEETADEIDAEVMREIVDTAFKWTVALPTERRALLERTARRLLEKETLTEAGLRTLTGAPPVRPAIAAFAPTSAPE